MARIAADSLTFLAVLDTDPDEAWAGFYSYGMRLLAGHRVLRWFPAEQRGELLHDFLCDCCVRSFRVLRQYRDQGQGFDGWLYRVATNWLYDRSRALRRSRVEPLDAADRHPAGGPQPEREASRRELWASVGRCVSRLSAPCRILLAAHIVDMLPPREMTILLGLPVEKNKEVSDMLRHCRQRLRQSLLNAGIDPSVIQGS